MASTYSPILRYELPGNGEQANTWGTTTNTNIGTLIEQSIAGLTSIDITAGNVTLLSLNGASDQARQMMLNVIGSPSSINTILAPPVPKLYVVINRTTQSVKIQTTTLGTAYTVVAGAAAIVYTNGTDFGSAAGANLPLTGGTITGALEVDGALTHAGYTVLDANNYNTYTPTKTGTGASGTWGINITGNAATATNATNASVASYVNNGTANMSFVWSGVGGTPTYVWGSTASGAAYVYSPSNFSVNYANTAGSATTAGSTTTVTSGGNVTTTSVGVGTAASGVSGEIRATNNVTAYYTSDARLKNDQSKLTDALNKVKSLDGIEFNWNDEYIRRRGGEDGFFVRQHDVGVIAQQVQKVLPEAVAQKPDGFLGVQYEKLVPLLLEAIKELSDKVEALENR